MTRNQPIDITSYCKELLQRFRDAYQIVRNNLKGAHDTQKHYYDLKHKDKTFAIGSKVWLYTPAKKKGLAPKLQSMWHGPYRIYELVSALVYRLQDLDGKPLRQSVHIQRLKKYMEGESRPTKSIKLLDADNFDSSQEETIQTTPCTSRENVNVQTRDDNPTKTGAEAHRNANQQSPAPSPTNLSTLQPLYECLKNMSNTVGGKITVTKSLLRNLLCEGSLYISNSGRQQHFRHLIGSLGNEQDMKNFLNKCVDDFNKTFAYELNKIWTGLRGE
jgi:hypothetical protein